jgi:dipeptidyl aminopeptidase/acylaminoacyl peptidase
MANPFDIDHFLALPRLSNLHLSPDGSRLAVTVTSAHHDGKRMISAIWQVDAAGLAAPRRLTRSAQGESTAAFQPDGSLLFTSSRPDPDAKRDESSRGAEPAAGLWLLPASGGEARLLLLPHGGVRGIQAARTAGTIVFAADIAPGTSDLETDEAWAKARHDAGVEAILFDSYPIRYWDHYLGPRTAHLFALEPPGDAEAPIGQPADLAPQPEGALVECEFDVTPDGTRVVTSWRMTDREADMSAALLVIDRSTGRRRTLAGGPDDWYGAPACSPDGDSVAALHEDMGGPERASQVSLVLIDLASGNERALAPDLDRRPGAPVWNADGSALFFTADEDGQTLPWRLDLADGRVTRLAIGASYSDLCPSPDGSSVFALRASVDRPPHVVRLDATAVDQAGTELRSPATPEDELPRRGRVVRLEATAPDGHPIRSWLVLPPGASATSPAPLVVFVHGGPLGSWTGWHWRWNPNMLAERGYAVLLPDPAISTGYGHAFVARGWGRWHLEPFTDMLAAVDGALARDDLDPKRTALMGGSFGGYMANWVAGRTGDRFRCIITHASLWELRGFHGTTDDGSLWEREFGDPYRDPSRYLEQSPSQFVDRIRVPMLVIHGERDHRVPISEALRLWTDLRRHGVESRFLYFPDENHWVLKPQNAHIWYATVLAFLDEHVLDVAWHRPDLV